MQLCIIGVGIFLYCLYDALTKNGALETILYMKVQNVGVNIVLTSQMSMGTASETKHERTRF